MLSPTESSGSWTRLVALTAAALFMATVLIGCAATGGGGMRVAEAVQHPMLPGIPVPRGFVSIDEKSKAHESGRFRFASYEFVGNGNRDSVHEFFVEKMPTAGFKLLQRRDEGGVYTLNFRSKNEECTIRVGSRGFRTYAAIDVWPLPQGTPRENADLPPPRGDG